MSGARTDSAGALSALRELGLMLETDRAFPSLVALMAGGPVKGTWWAHPLANDIYMVGMGLMDLPEVIFIRLLSGKMTYVHQRLWPALYAIASAREPWQLASLPPTAASMLKMLDRRESLRMDEIRSSRSAKELGADARLLEARMLVFGDDVHTDSGAHVKRIETWQSWAKRVGFPIDKIPSIENARREFEQIVASLNQTHAAAATLPWQTPARRKPARRS
jgi:hypothetical protein